jgi:hypothetical protein
MSSTLAAVARTWAADRALRRAVSVSSLRAAVDVLRALDALAAAAARIPLTVLRPRRTARPRCGARCRDGHPCAAPVVARRDEHGAVIVAARCRMHGGLSTGPRTPEGRRRALDALARGRAARWSRESSADQGNDQGNDQEAAGGSR